MNPFYVTCSDRLAGSAASAGCDPPQGSKPSPARATRSKRQRSRTCHRAWLPVQAAYAGQSLVTIRRTPHGADDRQATQSSPPSPRSDPTVQRQAYRTRLFRHACDVASASPAAIAFREVGTAHSVRPTLAGQSLRRAWFPVRAAYAGQSLVTIRRTPHGADDREATPSSPPSPPYARLWQSLPHAQSETCGAAGDCRPDHNLGAFLLGVFFFTLS